VAVGSVAVRDLAGRAALQERIAHLEDQNAALRDEQQRLQAERERLVADNERLRVEGERLRETNQRLRAEVEALRRAAKRQAAPFSRNDRPPNPNLPGASRARPTAGTRTGSHPSTSTRWSPSGCRAAAPAAAASWSWSESLPSMSRISPSPAR
jgi:regulator of replication initiation timing